MGKVKNHNPFLKASLPEDHVSYWMRYVSNNAAFTFSQKLAKKGVTVAEWIILRQMYTCDWLSPTDIMDRTGLTQGAISKLMDRLIIKGFIIKQVSDKDHRYKKMRLTATGHKIVPVLASIADQNDMLYFGHLSSRQKKQLVDLLKNIVKARRMRKLLNVHT